MQLISQSAHIILAVSKETRDLQLFWSASHTPVTVAADLQMPQFSIQKVKPTTCNNQFHLGESMQDVSYVRVSRGTLVSILDYYPMPSTPICVISVSGLCAYVQTISQLDRVLLFTFSKLRTSALHLLPSHFILTEY